MHATSVDSLVVSTSSSFFMELDLVDRLVEEYEDSDNSGDDEGSVVSWLSTTASPVSSRGSPCIAKRIRPDLDPLPHVNTGERTEYFTVDNYVWPTPKKRESYRMPASLRRQRHRESQREFMARKRAQFDAMRTEIRLLENQVQYLHAQQELQTLATEHKTLQANVDTIVDRIQERVWKTEAL